jgi:hypothetical protein
MLKPAYPYKEKLQKAYNKIVFDDFYKFYNNSQWWSHEFTLMNDSWKSLEFVSVDSNDEVIGFLKADIEHPEGYISGLGAMNLTNKANYCFSKDLDQFLKDLFVKFNFYKITFNVVVGNPIEKMYDKYIKKYGGKVVGYFKQHVMLQDGKLYDRKYYEIFREDFLREA